jgi:L-ascorbate metabolism protein UlaG (beta-lactamase superfamily)
MELKSIYGIKSYSTDLNEQFTLMKTWRIVNIQNILGIKTLIPMHFKPNFSKIQREKYPFFNFNLSNFE